MIGGANIVVSYHPPTMVTWLHLRTHHLWRTIKEVGLLSEDHLRSHHAKKDGRTRKEGTKRAMPATEEAGEEGAKPRGGGQDGGLRRGDVFNFHFLTTSDFNCRN